MIEIQFHPDAEIEYRNALRWYLKHNIQAAIEFETEFEYLLRMICNNPNLFPAHDHRRRLSTIHRYPYSVVYEPSENRILILAIAHHRQKPDYFSYRL